MHSFSSWLFRAVLVKCTSATWSRKWWLRSPWVAPTRETQAEWRQERVKHPSDLKTNTDWFSSATSKTPVNWYKPCTGRGSEWQAIPLAVCCCNSMALGGQCDLSSRQAEQVYRLAWQGVMAQRGSDHHVSESYYPLPRLGPLHVTGIGCSNL